MDQLKAGPDDLALAQGASGGDLLFLESCKERGVRSQLLLPLEEPDFIDCSILPSDGGDKWRDRFYALKSGLKDAPLIMPDELGPLSKGVDPFERCNLWLLYTALSYGIDKVRFICLWDGGGGDGPGGTAHMYQEVKRKREESCGLTAGASSRMLKKSLFSPTQPRRLLHPPTLSLPRQPLCPGTRRSPSCVLMSLHRTVKREV